MDDPRTQDLGYDNGGVPSKGVSPKQNEREISVSDGMQQPQNHGFDAPLTSFAAAFLDCGYLLRR